MLDDMVRQWWSRVPLWVWCLLMALGAVAAAGAALWQVPWWIDHHYLKSKKLTPAVATTVTGVRTALVALGAGGLAVVGILYTHRTWQQVREGQVTDRYTKAIGQIASDNPVEQLGGIYALERIMRDSPKDHATIVRATCPLATARQCVSHDSPSHSCCPIAHERAGPGSADGAGPTARS
ncbi:hypothetical protein ACWDE9_37375 [Streptomyces olivaceoviridis]